MARFPIPDELARITLPLWEGPAPLSHGTAPDDTPSLTPFLPVERTKATPAMVIIPGGGYMEHAFDGAGIALAENFQRRGIATFLLRYRLAVDHYHHPAQLLDAQRAIRLIRYRAAEWNIDSGQIAIMGFSAGGHLGALLATHSEPGERKTIDPVDRQESRPDFAVLIYPVISLLRKSGSTIKIAGPDPTPALKAQLSAETQVTSQTPPTLLVHGIDDTTVDVEHSRLMFAALQRAGVSSAFHEYPEGKHGFGTWSNDPCPPNWLERIVGWLQSVGYQIASERP